MKKGLILVLLFACLFTLPGCDPGTTSLDADELLANTVKIELVYYENSNPKNIHHFIKNRPSFDFSKITYIAALDDSRIEDVVRDISQQYMMAFGTSLTEPIGKTLILHQRDGSMIVIFGCVYKNERGGTRYYGECNVFDENGIFIEYIGDIDSEYVDYLQDTYFEIAS